MTVGRDGVRWAQMGWVGAQFGHSLKPQSHNPLQRWHLGK